MDAAEPKEIPMIKPNSKRKSASRSKSSKTIARNRAAKTAVCKTAKLKPDKLSAADQRPRTLAQATGRAESKQARIIAMLRSSSGATIDAMADAAGWQQHSVRGFLAGIVRKKLGLNLVSMDGDNGRVYRIKDRTASAAA